MDKGSKVTHPKYVDFNSDENYDELAINHANQDKTNDDDKKEIEHLTKELNTLKLAHETTLEYHQGGAPS